MAKNKPTETFEKSGDKLKVTISEKNVEKSYSLSMLKRKESMLIKRRDDIISKHNEEISKVQELISQAESLGLTVKENILNDRQSRLEELMTRRNLR